MIISFGWTTPALLAGAKTVTRRDWKPEHAAKFKAGMLVDAWNTSPRNVHMSPRKVAVIRLTADPVLEHTDDAPMSDWLGEGFELLQQQGIKVARLKPAELWQRWHEESQSLYVVRFEVVELLETLDIEAREA